MLVLTQSSVKRAHPDSRQNRNQTADDENKRSRDFLVNRLLPRLQRNNLLLVNAAPLINALPILKKDFRAKKLGCRNRQFVFMLLQQAEPHLPAMPHP